MVRRFIKYLAIGMGLLSLAYSAHFANSKSEEGRVLLWHSWEGKEATALHTLLDRFNDVYPHITVIAAPYRASELQNEFADQVMQGLGPDLMVGDQMWIPELAEAGFIEAISEDEVDMSDYLTSAVNTLRYKNRIYGIPLSVRTWALYYNRSLVDEPPSTLRALLEQAQDGHKVAFNSNFVDAFWGISAFGGELVDEQGKIILNQGGFANWLTWLLEAQNVPNVLINNDQPWLVDKFIKGEVAYYIGNSSEILSLQADIGEESLGVAPLPAGPNNTAGPFLQTESLFFSTASSDQQIERAILLAQFLTNGEQQRKLAQQAGRIPASTGVRIDRRISPAIAGFVEQSKTAIPFRLLPQYFTVVDLGNEAYMETLEGLLDPSQAADELTIAANKIHDFPSDFHLVNSEDANVECEIADPRQLTVWHSWSAFNADILQQIVSQFHDMCSNIDIQLTALESSELIEQYQTGYENETAPDLVILPHQQLSHLAASEQLRNLDDLVDPGFLQRYAPAVSSAMRTDGHLYGLPLTMDMMVLYYNAEVTEEEPRSLSDLLSILSPELRLAMPYAPSHRTHWGIAAFGGQLFNASGQLTLQDKGITEWLHWLREAQEHTGVLMTRGQEEAVSHFTAGDAAYLVADQNALIPLITQMGTTKIRAVPLPAGPEGPSAPVIEVEGIALNSTSSQPEAALLLARYLTERESQSQFMNDGYLIPVNTTVPTPSHPAIDAFWDQSKTAKVLPNRAETTAIVELGDALYTGVLEDERAPEAVVADFSQFITSTYDSDGENEDDLSQLTFEVDQCTQSGQLRIWHSNQGEALRAIDQIAADFARICPNVHLSLEYIDDEQLPNRLASLLHSTGPDAPERFHRPEDGQPIGIENRVRSKTGAAGSEPPIENPSPEESGAVDGPESEMRDLVPDLILAPHDLIAPLSEERLIKPIDPWVDSASLIPYQPITLEAMRHRDALYGYPYNFSVLSLYVNTSLISDTMTISYTPDSPILFSAPEFTQSTPTGDAAPLPGSSSGRNSIAATNAVTRSGVVTGNMGPGQINLTIADLVGLVSEDQQLALANSFQYAFWGIGAFAHKPQDSRAAESNGRPIIDQQGLLHWLRWLHANQSLPGFVLNPDQHALIELFAAGNAAYLIADSDALPSLRAELSPETSDHGDLSGPAPIAVLPLPSGPSGNATPYLTVRGFLLPAKSDEAQAKLALRFARFATSADRQVEMASEAQRPPANALALAHITDSAINTFVQQAQSSVLLPARPWNLILSEAGDQLLNDVLVKETSPDEAIASFIAYLEEATPPSVIAYAGDGILDCTSGYQLTIWHTWLDDEIDGALKRGGIEQVIADFTKHCPGVQVRLKAVPSQELSTELEQNLRLGSGPDLVLAAHHWLPSLASAGLIQPLSHRISPSQKERYVPKTLAALNFEELYGLPMFASVLALYYNSDLVKTPIGSLADLQASTTISTPIALDSSLHSAIWGLQTFGAAPLLAAANSTSGGFDENHGNVRWLTWLRSFQNQPGVLLGDSREQIRREFASGRAAYLIDGPEALSSLRAQLGNRVRVVPLPPGPGGPAAPVLEVDAIFMPYLVNEMRARLALNFAEFATSLPQQRKLSKDLLLLPAVVDGTAPAHDSALEVFRRQVDEASLVLPVTTWQTLMTDGASAYQAFLTDTLTPLETMEQVFDAFTLRNPLNGRTGSGRFTPIPLWKVLMPPEEF